jgi:Bacterial DNA-binding protein
MPLLVGGFFRTVKQLLPNHKKGLIMNRTELIAAMAEKTSSTKVDADKAIGALIDIITATLKKGDNV